MLDITAPASGQYLTNMGNLWGVKRETLVLDKLVKWNGKSALRWDDAISDLQAMKGAE